MLCPVRMTPHRPIMEENEIMTEELDPFVLHVADTIDRLVSIDVSGYGVIGKLYDAARAHHGMPLSLLAATTLATNIKPLDTFFVTTGWILPGTYPYTETDGPIGAAILGRALALGLGARMVVLTEEPVVDTVRACCRAAGLNVLSEDDLQAAPRPPHDGNAYCIVKAFPYGDAEAIEESRKLFDQHSPKALVAIEKSGPNADGQYCMVDGSDNSDCVIRAARLFDEAKRRGVCTVGIGDRGNEIGFGTIQTVPQKLLPFGEQATCTTEVDVLVTAAVSNWGASAIAAAMAVILKNPDVVHDAVTEARLLEAAIGTGAVDGFSHRPIRQTDGMGVQVHTAIVDVLNEIVRAPAASGLSLSSTPLFQRPA